MMLVHDEVKPDTQRVLDLLMDYRIEHSLGMEDMDFMRHVNHFLGAKKSEGLADKSTLSYRLHLTMFNDHINKKAADVTTNDIRDYITYLSEVRENRIATIQTSLSILRSFFTWMHMEELISKNPTTKVKSFRINKRDARHPLSPEDMERLRNSCNTYREKALVEFLFSTGCRLSEAIQIDYRSLDLNRRSVEVIGKGRKPRTLYFSIKAWLMIDEYIKERKGGTALFCSVRDPYKRLGERAIQKILKQLGERAGITRRIHPHVLRHTFATHMLNSGMDITVIQKLLGHASVGTTEIYAEISQEKVHHEYQKFIA